MQPLCGASALARWGFVPSRGQPFAALGASRAVLEVDGFGYQARHATHPSVCFTIQCTLHVPCDAPCNVRPCRMVPHAMHHAMHHAMRWLRLPIPGVARLQAHARLCADRAHLALPALVRCAARGRYVPVRNHAPSLQQTYTSSGLYFVRVILPMAHHDNTCTTAQACTCCGYGRTPPTCRACYAGSRHTATRPRHCYTYYGAALLTMSRGTPRRLLNVLWLLIMKRGCLP